MGIKRRPTKKTGKRPGSGIRPPRAKTGAGKPPRSKSALPAAEPVAADELEEVEEVDDEIEVVEEVEVIGEVETFDGSDESVEVIEEDVDDVPGTPARKGRKTTGKTEILSFQEPSIQSQKYPYPS